MNDMTTTELPPAMLPAKPIEPPPGVQLADSQAMNATQKPDAVGTKLPPAIAVAKPMVHTPGDSNFTSSQEIAEPHMVGAAGDQTSPLGHADHVAQSVTALGGNNFPADQGVYEHQSFTVGGDQTTSSQVRRDPHSIPAAGSNLPPTNDLTEPSTSSSAGQTSSPVASDLPRTHAIGAAGEDQPSAADQRVSEAHGSPVGRGPLLASPMLGMAAEVVDDLERVRIANENRYRTLTATDEFGFGLTDDHPDIARLRNLVDSLAAAEHQAILNLQRVMRQHPLGPWVKAAPGVGEKQAARLLSAIRDPYWNDLHNRPRTVSELWAYCGFHVIRPTGGQHRDETHNIIAAGSTCHTDGQGAFDTQRSAAVGVAPKRQRGQKSNWSEDARKRAWLIAASCIKMPPGTRYRDVYDQTRAKYAEAAHAVDCVRCGPAGKPALAGTPISAGHQHARAMRAIAKTVLKDLWIEAKRIHEEAQP